MSELKKKNRIRPTAEQTSTEGKPRTSAGRRTITRALLILREEKRAGIRTFFIHVVFFFARAPGRDIEFVRTLWQLLLRRGGVFPLASHFRTPTRLPPLPNRLCDDPMPNSRLFDDESVVDDAWLLPLPLPPPQQQPPFLRRTLDAVDAALSKAPTAHTIPNRANGDRQRRCTTANKALDARRRRAKSGGRGVAIAAENFDRDR